MHIRLLTKSAKTSVRLTEIEIFLSLQTQMFQVQKRGEPPLSKYTLSEINMVEPCDCPVTDTDYEASQADKSFTHCFKIQCRSNGVKVIACASANDRAQWIRCLTLVLKLKHADIVDLGQMCLFTFEKHYNEQLIKANA